MKVQLVLAEWGCSSALEPELQVKQAVKTVGMNDLPFLLPEVRWKREKTGLTVPVSSDIELLFVSDVPRLQPPNQLGLSVYDLLSALQVEV